VKCKSGAGCLRAAILAVAYDGVSDPGEMNADLVFPARQQVYFQQSIVLRLLKHSIGFPLVRSGVEYMTCALFSAR